MTTSKIYAQLSDANDIIDDVIDKMKDFPTIDKLENEISELKYQLDKKFHLVLHVGDNFVYLLKQFGAVICRHGYNVGMPYKENELSIAALENLKRKIDEMIFLKNKNIKVWLWQIKKRLKSILEIHYEKIY